MRRIGFLVICLGLFSFGASGVLACGGETSDIHIGSVTEVDGRQNTFTIADVETGQALTFSASREVLLKLNGIQRRVAVKYKQEGLMLVALGVR